MNDTHTAPADSLLDESTEGKPRITSDVRDIRGEAPVCSEVKLAGPKPQRRWPEQEPNQWQPGAMLTVLTVYAVNGAGLEYDKEGDLVRMHSTKVRTARILTPEQSRRIRDMLDLEDEQRREAREAADSIKAVADALADSNMTVSFHPDPLVPMPAADDEHDDVQASVAELDAEPVTMPQRTFVHPAHDGAWITSDAGDALTNADVTELMTVAPPLDGEGYRCASGTVVMWHAPTITSGEPETDPRKMKKPQLLAHAEGLGIDVSNCKTVPDLRRAIQLHEQPADPHPEPDPEDSAPVPPSDFEPVAAPALALVPDIEPVEGGPAVFTEGELEAMSDGQLRTLLKGHGLATVAGDHDTLVSMVLTMQD